MERLTHRREDGVAIANKPTASFLDSIIEQCARYEETGLSPEICSKYKLFEDKCIQNGVSFDRVVELIEADIEFRLTVYPRNDHKTCGKCANFEREPGTRRGRCLVRNYHDRHREYPDTPLINSVSRKGCTKYFVPKEPETYG